MSSNELAGKCVLVTGGADGIGLECSRLLLERGTKKLAVLDTKINRDSCRKMESNYGRSRVIFIECDISNEKQLETAFEEVIRQFGKLDFIINNAGILDDLDWRSQVAVNVNGTIHGTLLALKYMSVANGGAGGTIVNISSLAGLVPSGGCPLYSATSAAIISLTRAFATPFHLSRSGVKMVTVCPGITYTRIISGACKKMLDEETGREWLKELSTTSTQQPENVAVCVVDALLRGDSGSVWVSEGGNPAYKVIVPDLRGMRYPQASSSDLELRVSK